MAEVDIGAITAEHREVLLSGYNILDNNALLVSEPSIGNMTFTNFITSTETGLPFNLFVRTPPRPF